MKSLLQTGCFAFLLATACSCGSVRESSVADAGVTADAARDATRSPEAAPIGSSDHDAGHDIGDARTEQVVPGDGGLKYPVGGDWQRIPGAPDWCGLRIALDPAVSVPEIKWEPCSSGQAGCWAHVADWGPANSLRLIIDQDQQPVPAIIDGVPHFVIARFWDFPGQAPDGGNQSYALYAVQPLTGKAKYGVLDVYPPDTEPQYCASAIGISSTGLAGSLSAVTPGEVIGEIIDEQTELWWFKWSNPPDITVHPLLPDEIIGRGPRTVVPHGNTIFGQMNRGPWRAVTVAIDTTTGKAHEPFEHATYVPLQDPMPVDEGAFVNSWESYPGVWFLPNWDWARCLWQPEPGRTMYGHTLDRSANNDVLWVDYDAGSETDYALWESPFATTDSDMRPRKVAALPDPRYGRFVGNLGLVLWLDSKGEPRLIRRSDGKGWKVPTTMGLQYINPIWVDEQYVWLSASTSDDRYPGPYGNAFVRIERSVLGQPTLGNGLGSTGETGVGKATQSTSAVRKRPPLDPRTIGRARP